MAITSQFSIRTKTTKIDNNIALVYLPRDEATIGKAWCVVHHFYLNETFEDIQIFNISWTKSTWTLITRYLLTWPFIAFLKFCIIQWSPKTVTCCCLACPETADWRLGTWLRSFSLQAPDTDHPPRHGGTPQDNIGNVDTFLNVFLLLSFYNTILGRSSIIF